MLERVSYNERDSEPVCVGVGVWVCVCVRERERERLSRVVKVVILRQKGISDDDVDNFVATWLTISFQLLFDLEFHF